MTKVCASVYFVTLLLVCGVLLYYQLGTPRTTIVSWGPFSSWNGRILLHAVPGM